MGSGLSLTFRWFGTTLTVRVAWLLALGLSVAYLIVSLDPPNFHNARALVWYAAAMIVVVGMIVSVLLHEQAHMLVARRLGATPQPVLLYPFGGISQGFADPGTPAKEARVAIAGPVFNLVAAFVLALFGLLIPPSAGIARNAVWVLAAGNATFAVLNLMPGFPLDGGQVLRALGWYLHDSYSSGTRIAVAYGQLIGLMGLTSGLVLLGTETRWSGIGALVTLVSWGLTQTGRQERTRSFLVVFGTSVTAGEMVVGINPHVRASQPLDEILDILLAEMHSGPALVMDDSGVVGIIGLEQLRRVPRQSWHSHLVRDSMIPLLQLPRLGATASVRDLLEQLSILDSPFMLVVDGDEVAGALDRRLAVHRLFERSRQHTSAARTRRLP